MPQPIDSQSASQRAPVRHAAVPVTITILCGVCLSVVSCVLIWRATDREALAEFNRRAGNRYFTLREGVHGQVEAMRALRDFYASSQHVDQQEFSRFAGALLSRHRGIRVLAWAEITPPAPPGPADRERSVRLVRVEPSDPHASALGVDLWQDPDCRRAMQQAARTNTPALAYCPGLKKRLGANFESLVLLSFFRPQAEAEPRPPSANQPHGYIVAGFDLGELLHNIYKGLDMGGVEVAVCRPKAASAATVIYKDDGRVIVDASREELDRARAGVHFTRQIAFADSSIDIVCWPTKQFMQRYSQWPAMLALIIGIAATGLLTTYLWCSASRIARQQRINVELELQINDRVVAEQALRHERDYAHSLVTTAQAIVLVLDEDAGIREINQYGEAILGYPLSELVGKNWFLTFPPLEDRQRQLATFKQGVIDRDIPDSESPIITREGRRVFFNWTTTIFDDLEDNPAGILAIGMDVTQRRRLLEQAQADAELRKVLLSELNHRVKNNLATISSLLYIELTRPTQDKDACIRSCQRRVDSLSELHAILSERISERVSVNTLIRRVAAATISGSPPPHPKVQVDLPEDGPTITADMASGLAMATSELISNALRHALPKVENPRLRISMHCHNSLCTLEIADNGPGLPPGFDAERDGGTGLSLVWFIAQKQLRGSLDLCHESGEMCFRLTFKCTEFKPKELRVES